MIEYRFQGVVLQEYLNNKHLPWDLALAIWLEAIYQRAMAICGWGNDVDYTFYV